MSEPYVIALVAAAALSAGPIGRQPTESTRFKPIEFVVGSCWTGTFPDGRQTDEHCFDWLFGHRFVRDRHIVRGGPYYEGETIYSWDPSYGESPSRTGAATD